MACKYFKWPTACLFVVLYSSLGELSAFAADPTAETDAPQQSALAEAPPNLVESEPTDMNNRRLGRLLREYFRELPVEGQPGYWRVQFKKDPQEAQQPEDHAAENGHPQEVGPGAGERLDPVLIVMTDERANRMRIMTPIRRFDPDRVEDLQLALIALHANYDRALDVRYAVQDGVLWSVFIHPLRSLHKKDLHSAIEQVLALRKNTGTTYNSSELFFGPQNRPEAEDSPEPEEPTDDDREMI